MVELYICPSMVLDIFYWNLLPLLLGLINQWIFCYNITTVSSAKSDWAWECLTPASYIYRKIRLEPFEIKIFILNLSCQESGFFLVF